MSLRILSLRRGLGYVQAFGVGSRHWGLLAGWNSRNRRGAEERIAFIRVTHYSKFVTEDV